MQIYFKFRFTAKYFTEFVQVIWSHKMVTQVRGSVRLYVKSRMTLCCIGKHIE